MVEEFAAPIDRAREPPACDLRQGFARATAWRWVTVVAADRTAILDEYPAARRHESRSGRYGRGSGRCVRRPADAVRVDRDSGLHRHGHAVRVAGVSRSSSCSPFRWPSRATFLALWLTGTPLSIIALIGAIMLVGIVTKNGIVLVDYTNLLVERGSSVFDAVSGRRQEPSASGADDVVHDHPRHVAAGDRHGRGFGDLAADGHRRDRRSHAARRC